jgi:tetratricopeptide (TPR) repeat protein
MKRIGCLILVLICSLPVFCQTTVEEEIGFRLVKAEYLLGTERFEDAIKELNEVIKQNPSYKNAMLLRAETKYKLAAYKGAKTDALEYININGITAKAAGILGKSEYALNSFDASLNSLTTAIVLGEKDAKLYEIRAEIFEIKNQKLSACEDWQNAAKLGSTKGAINAKKNCGVKIETPVETPPVQEPSTTTNNDNKTQDNTDPTDTGNNSGSTSSTNDDVVINNNTNTSKDTTIVKANDTPISEGTSESTTNNTNETNESGELLPQEDDTVNEVIIDEELTLQILGQGLGKRRLMEKPNILILAEKDGEVVIEICVNNDGRVDFAEFVPNKSTLNQNSLVSLAIRKTKEFWFEESEYPKQCGFVKFLIKGS